jgi:hypothetical protein
MRSGFVQFHEALEPLMTPIEQVHPHPENPNNGDVELIVESILTNGYIAPIVAQKETGDIIAGNHRYHALLSLGADIAPVIWVNMEDGPAKRYMLADNKTGQAATLDNSLVLNILTEFIDHEGGDMNALVGSGYNELDLKMLTELNKLENTPTGDYADWPTLTFVVPPKVKKAFYAITSQAGDDRDKFELLLRMAGWEGGKRDE